jgi:hypothetical protein
VSERVCDARLEGLGGCSRHLLGERRKLLALLGQRLGLLAGMFCPKFYECRRRLHAGHLLDKVKSGVGVRASEFNVWGARYS